MDQPTISLPAKFLENGIWFLQELRGASTVRQAFDIACHAVRQFAPNTCLNLWMSDESRECICRAHASLPQAHQTAHHSFDSHVPFSHPLKLLFEKERDCDWIPVDQLEDRRALACAGTAGIAYLRLNTVDGLSVLLTACVPRQMTGDYSHLPTYFRLLGQGLLHSIERIRKENQLSLLTEIASLAVDEETPDRFFKDVASRVAEAFGTMGCSIFTYDEFRDTLVLGGTTGLYRIDTNPSDAVPRQSQKLSQTQLADLNYQRGEGLTGWIFKHERVVRLYDAFSPQEVHNFDENSPIEPKFKSAEQPNVKPRTFLGAPIFDSGRLVGVIRLHGKPSAHAPEEQSGIFLPSDELRLKAVSDVLGKSMSRWVDVINVRESLGNSDALLSNLQKLIDDNHSLRPSLRTIAEQAKKLFRGCSAYILLKVAGDKEDALSVEAEACDKPHFEGKLRFPARLGNSGMSLQTRRLVVDENVDAPTSSFYGRHTAVGHLLRDVHSEVSAPILLGNQAIGVLCVDSERKGWFKPGDRKLPFLERLASQAALVIRREQDFAAATSQFSARALAHHAKDDFGAFLLRLSSITKRQLCQLDPITRKTLEDLRGMSQRRVGFWDALSDIPAFDKPRLQPMYLSDLVESIRHFFDIITESESIGLEMRLSPELSENEENASSVSVDVLQFLLVVSNLLNNAVNAMKEGGMIQVITELHGDSAHLLVIDTGVGVEDDLKAVLFEENPTSFGRKGKGCMVVKRIVESHGGDVWISDTPGGGATVTVSLPVIEED